MENLKKYIISKKWTTRTSCRRVSFELYRNGISKMAHGLKYLIFFLCVVSCIEPYDFVVHDDGHTLVVEAYITDKSFNETLTYPSDGRY
ncbi:MAG TPA: hypothetical protein VK666_14775, partial [Chryseolinea sp.]|nr:hypothetical protein [Chryseolinea sp.]